MPGRAAATPRPNGTRWSDASIHATYETSSMPSAGLIATPRLGSPGIRR